MAYGLIKLNDEIAVQNMTAEDQTLTEKMVWVIITATITFVITVAGTYFLKRV